MKVDVVLPHENFRGMSYGEWGAEWNKWLFSKDPDANDNGNMLFLRGNVDYKPVGNDPSSPKYVNPDAIYDRTDRNGVTIFDTTAIFIPVISTVFFIQDNFEGKILRNEQDLRYSINKERDETQEIWCAIKRKGDPKPSKLVVDVKQYRFESTIFKLEVPRDSKLRGRMQVSVKTGVYEAMTSGHFVIIRSLPASTYRIIFGGRGVGDYITNSVYDITVVNRGQDRIKDTSNLLLSSKFFRSFLP